MAEFIDRKEIFFEGKQTGNKEYDEGFLDGAMCVLDAIDEMPAVKYVSKGALLQLLFEEGEITKRGLEIARKFGEEPFVIIRDMTDEEVREIKELIEKNPPKGE